MAADAKKSPPQKKGSPPAGLPRVTQADRELLQSIETLRQIPEVPTDATGAAPKKPSEVAATSGRHPKLLPAFPSKAGK